MAASMPHRIGKHRVCGIADIKVSKYIRGRQTRVALAVRTVPLLLQLYVVVPTGVRGSYPAAHATLHVVP